MDEWEQSQAAGGPGTFALEWVRAVANADPDVWHSMSADFRLAMAQGWLVHNPEAFRHPSAEGLDRDELAARLAAPTPRHELFEHVIRVSLRELAGMLGGLDVELLQPGARPRPMGPDLELIRLLYLPDMQMDSSGNLGFAPGTWARGVSVLVQRAGAQWEIAGIGDGILRPGWPPTYDAFIKPAD